MQGGAAFAALAMIGTGARESAARIMQALDQDTAPTAVASATRAMAAGIWESITGSPSVALATLSRGAALFESSAPRAVLLPDSPSALTALLAIHCGHLDTAEWAVTRAVELELGGPTCGTRHLLLRGWVAMLQGAYQQARTWRDEAAAGLGPAGWAAASPRDQLLRWGLDIGLARRTSDVPGLVSTWSQVREVVLRHPVDLSSPASGGRVRGRGRGLRESERMSAMLDEARALLAGLGDPITWSAPLHWAGVQAARPAGQPGDAQGARGGAGRRVPHQRRRGRAGAGDAEDGSYVLGGKTDVDHLQRSRARPDRHRTGTGPLRLLAQAAAGRRTGAPPPRCCRRRGRWSAAPTRTRPLGRQRRESSPGDAPGQARASRRGRRLG